MSTSTCPTAWCASIRSPATRPSAATTCCACAARGGSAWVHDHLRVGQRLHIGTPRNLFSLTPAAHTILVAGGIGVTPLLAMAYALQEQAQSFELHYYVRDRSDAAFMHQLERRFAPGQVQLHCSAQGDSLRHGLPTALQTPRPDGQIYTCGPDPFMHHLRTQALALGWQADQLHQEAFGAATSAAGSTGQPGEDQAFEVQLASSQQIHVIPPGQSIASVLLNAGVDVPVSCEMGICGACLTTVEDGEPDHRDSVQTPEELAATPVKMAVCCSRARSPRLVLRL